jgi:hypothetical protein
MKLRRTICSLILAALLTTAAGAQLPQAKKPSDDPEAVKKEVIAFLRETMADVNNLRTLENRISFSAELAGLMWFHDEKEAKSLYMAAFANFKELLMQYDMQMNNFGEPEEGEGSDDPGSYRRGMFVEASDRSILHRRFQTAMQVRQQIALSLAEHDPDLAFTFYNDSVSAVTNPEFRKKLEGRDTFFETQLLAQIARTNAAKASQLATASISGGVNYQHLDLLQKIHEKDPEKGAEFAAAILSKLKTVRGDDIEYWTMGSFLGIAGAAYEASKKEGGKKPMLTQSELRDLADTLAQGILDSSGESGNGLQYVDQIEKYAPSRALQIRRKFKMSSGAAWSNVATNASVTRRAGTTNMNSNAYNAYSEEMVEAASNSNSRAERERLEREKTEKEFQQNVEKLANKELPKSEREKVVAQARKILLQTPGKDKKILGLSALAAHVSRAGDKELAADIMKEAQALVNPRPKNYQEFILTWMLASGYAMAEPEKAFPLLEDTIERVNDTITAFIKVGEFIDAAGEMIEDGEVQVGAFGGQMVRGLTGELAMADATLRTLAKADLAKTKNLTSRFDRTEVRILAKMMILRAVLGEEKQKKEDAAPALPEIK